VVELHCHVCGGFITELRYISYRLPDGVAATPHRDLCTCTTPVVYGPPPGYMTSPGFPAANRTRG